MNRFLFNFVFVMIALYLLQRTVDTPKLIKRTGSAQSPLPHQTIPKRLAHHSLAAIKRASFSTPGKRTQFLDAQSLYCSRGGDQECCSKCISRRIASIIIYNPDCSRNCSIEVPRLAEIASAPGRLSAALAYINDRIEQANANIIETSNVLLSLRDIDFSLRSITPNIQQILSNLPEMRQLVARVNASSVEAMRQIGLARTRLTQSRNAEITVLTTNNLLTIEQVNNVRAAEEAINNAANRIQTIVMPNTQEANSIYTSNLSRFTPSICQNYCSQLVPCISSCTASQQLLANPLTAVSTCTNTCRSQYESLTLGLSCFNTCT
jgi:hypothetical protein